MDNQVLEVLVEIKKEMQEMKQGMQEMKQDMFGMKQELKETKQELKMEIQETKNEMKIEIQETNNKMKLGFESVNTRLDSIESKLDGIGYQFEQQTAHTTETVTTIENKTAYLLEKSQLHDIELHRIKQKI